MIYGMALMSIFTLYFSSAQI